MSELGDTYKAMREHSQEKRADNREQSAQYLTNAGIPFTSHNGGAHLIVEGRDCFIDFWPGTGKWIGRKGEQGFGVRNLVKYITGAGSPTF